MIAQRAEELLAEAETARGGGDLAALRIEYLGRKGKVAELLKEAVALPESERRSAAPAVQRVRVELEKLLALPVAADPWHDLTLPASTDGRGSIHPISAMITEMSAIFRDIGFEVAEGKEIVGTHENFDWLNMGPDHPARDPQDTFYLPDGRLLRTQTTAAQVVEIRSRREQGRIPMRLVVPGRTYRREADQTHSAMFHQMDAVVVDDRTNFAELKGTLAYFIDRLFGGSVETRFRPHHFPFTEPSAELDIRLRGGAAAEGKHRGWLEFGGCGMIHPAVLKRAGLDSRSYRGWAFGMSVERPIMIRSGVPDIRSLYAGEAAYLSTFGKRI